MSNTQQFSDPDTMISQIGKNAGGVYLIDPVTQKAISPSSSSSSVADTVATGSLTAAQPTVGTPVAGGTVSITLGNGQAVVEVQLTGTFNAGTTVLFEGTEDTGVTTNWFSTFGQDTSTSSPSNISSIAGGASKIIRIPSMGYTQIRVRANPFAGGDNVAVRMVASVAGTSAGSLSTQDNIAQIGGVNTQMGASGGTMVLANSPAVVVGLWNGGSNLNPLQSVAGDNSGTGNAAFVGSALINPSGNLDRQRGNIDNISLISATGTTTTQTGSDQTNYNGRGVVVILDMTTVGTGSVTLEIDGKDPVSGKYYAILTGAAVVTNSTNVYTIYPGNTVAANVSASTVLPRTWRVKATANNANATTFTVGAIVIL